MGYAVAPERPKLDGADYWAIAEAPGGWRTELAFLTELEDWEAWARGAFGIDAEVHFLSIRDRATGRQSLALFSGERLVFALYLAPDPVLVSRQWAVGLLSESIAPARRADILAGRPGGDRPDPGRSSAPASGWAPTRLPVRRGRGCHTVEAIGAALKAGTNCGSCRAEIRGLIEVNRLEAAE